jgi:hypothetical protein
MEKRDYLRLKSNSMLATAASPMTAAAMARPISSPLTPRRITAGPATGRATDGAGAAAIAGRAAVPVAGAAGAGRAVGGGAGAAVAGRGAVGGAAGAAVAGAAAGAPPAAGNEGSLIVAVAGLGGRLIRTVSFFGWTFAASAGFGGTPPGGLFGVLSAIVSR